MVRHFFPLILLVALAGVACISISLGGLPFRADLACLVLAGLAVVCYFGGILLYSLFDKTNGNDSGLIIFWVLSWLYLIVVLWAAGSVLLFGGTLMITLIAGAVIVCAGALGLSQLIL